jgi:hypothetical protein
MGLLVSHPLLIGHLSPFSMAPKILWHDQTSTALLAELPTSMSARCQESASNFSHVDFPKEMAIE